MLVLCGHAGVPFIVSGGVGVDIFFVLSGFLITSILSEEIERRGRLRLGNFYVRRILRLFPALCVTIALFCIVTVAEEHRFPTTIALVAITHTANWARAMFDVPMASLQHFWSLASEEQYYLVWPLIVVALERSIPGYTNKALALLVLAAALAGYRYSMVDTFEVERIYFALDTHMDGLVLGSALSYFLRAPGTADMLTRNGRMLAWLLVPTAIVVLIVLMHSMSWRDPGMGKYGFLLAAVAAAVIIGDLVAGPRSLLRSPLSLAPVVYIGRISYGIYLLHLLVFHIADRLLPGTAHVIVVPVKFAASIAAATLSYYGYEQRFLKLKTRFRSGMPTDATVPVCAVDAPKSPP
jgi:peptidoglycan/LPS O-acetylase OafA/YrhL